MSYLYKANGHDFLCDYFSHNDGYSWSFEVYFKNKLIGTAHDYKTVELAVSAAKTFCHHYYADKYG